MGFRIKKRRLRSGNDGLNLELPVPTEGEVRGHHQEDSVQDVSVRSHVPRRQGQLSESSSGAHGNLRRNVRRWSERLWSSETGRCRHQSVRSRSLDCRTLHKQGARHLLRHHAAQGRQMRTLNYFLGLQVHRTLLHDPVLLSHLALPQRVKLDGQLVPLHRHCRSVPFGNLSVLHWSLSSSHSRCAPRFSHECTSLVVYTRTGCNPTVCLDLFDCYGKGRHRRFNDRMHQHK